MQKVQFQEDDNTVEMEVQADQDNYSEVPETDSESEKDSEDDNEDEESEASELNESMQSEQPSTSRQEIIEKERQATVEAKIDTLSTAVMGLQSMMEKRGMFNPPKTKSKKKKITSPRKKKTKCSGESIELTESTSDDTIYHNAINLGIQEHDDDSNLEDNPEITFNESKRNRESTSSEDHVNTSDELMDIDVNDQFIADCAAEARGNNRNTPREDRARQVDRREKALRESEAGKARMYKKAGNDNLEFGQNFDGIPQVNMMSNLAGRAEVQHSAFIDENYMVIGPMWTKRFIRKL